jgi:hypothetical protein
MVDAYASENEKLRKANTLLHEQIGTMSKLFENTKWEYVQLFNRHNSALAKLDEIRGIVK